MISAPELQEHYGAVDFETSSVHSVTPTYVSDTPSYHSRRYSDDVPPYTPRGAEGITLRTPNQSRPRTTTNGLPPVPLAKPEMSLKRRVIEGRRRQRNITTPATAVAIEPAPLRPLEDPYLVGETAAAAAKRERLARETTDDVLLVEDRRWDWFLGTMDDWDERDRSWAKFRARRSEKGQASLLRNTWTGRWFQAR